MDTLVIVRKIRESEALAEKGQHGEARKMLEPLLAGQALSEAHRELLKKKIEVFEKQRERATRMVSRKSAGAPPERNPSDDTDMGSGRKPSSGDTTVERPALQPGAPTEALALPPQDATIDRDTTKLRKRPEPEPSKPQAPPEKDLVSLYDSEAAKAASNRADAAKSNRDKVKSNRVRNADTDIPSRPQSDTDIPSRATPASGSNRLAAGSNRVSSSSNRRPAEQRVVERPPEQPKTDLRLPNMSDLAPLAPESEAQKLAVEALPPGAPTEAAPKTPEIAALLKRRPQAELAPLAPVVDDKFASDEMPKLDAESKGLLKPMAMTPPPSVRVQDTLITPQTPPSTLVETRASVKSSKDLTNMVEKLPDHDERKELALEVVRLREELDKAKSTSTRRDTDKTGAGGSRRIIPGEKPESSIFKIPSNRVNTIVRTAAGTSDITAHMPTRDEDVPELHVLRRESMKKPAEGETPSARLNLAQDYIDASPSDQPRLYKTLAAVLGILVIVGLVVWAVYWGVTAMNAGESSGHPAGNAR